MSDDAKTPDYTTMSGAEFKRAVGADPEKWAVEFQKAADAFRHTEGLDVQAERTAFIAAWFRDAMEAAVRHAVAPRWDQQYSDEDLEAAAKQAVPEWDENSRRARIARENEVARRHSGEPEP